MTDKEILQKAIEKARKNGADYRYDPDEIFKNLHYYAIIFQHDFAKALWGEWNCQWTKSQGIIPIKVETATQGDSGIEIWQYHLQQIILVKEPLKYIEKFL